MHLKKSALQALPGRFLLDDKKPLGENAKGLLPKNDGVRPSEANRAPDCAWAMLGTPSKRPIQLAL